MSVGERIRKVRRSLDLTQAEFAARIGSTQNTVTRYETGDRKPSATVLAMIGQTYGVSVEWLRSGTGDMFLPKEADTLEALARERGLSHGAYVAIEKLLNVKPDVLDSLVDYCLEVAAALGSEKAAQDAPALAGAAIVEADAAEAEGEADAALEREADEYAALAREQFLSERKRGSGASGAKGSGVG